ncbi:MAG: threonine ammonia-lyase [Candidatus Kariarchaeaceae archaeon]
MNELVTLERIKQARELLGDSVRTTPVVAIELADQTYALQLKLEELQKVGSFKLRGVLNKFHQLTDEEKERGVITISAGNHAQSLAYAAQQVGVKSLVVMPPTAPSVKVDNTRNFGAEVVFEESTKLLGTMMRIKEERSLTLVHPFDDLDVIAGAGTVGLEICEQVPSPDIVIVPIGGGGLIAGVSTAVKSMYPAARVIGVEPEGACGMYLSKEKGEPVTLDTINTVADGLAAPFAGANNLRHVMEYVDEIVLVDDDEILQAVKTLALDHKLVVEPAGAAGIAALQSGKIIPPDNSTVVCVISGGNIDRKLLSELVKP